MLEKIDDAVKTETKPKDINSTIPPLAEENQQLAKNDLITTNLTTNDVAIPEQKIDNITKSTKFSDVVDDAKINIIKEASANDEKFVADLKNKLKEAATEAAELEKDKQTLERKNLELEENYIKTKTELEQQTQSQNKWTNKEKAREYHYNGLKDIMLFLHINNPMCIPLMYIFAVIGSPLYLVWTLILSPIGTLICGTKDNERPKSVKGAIYTILCLALVILVAFSVYACGHFWFKWF